MAKTNFSGPITAGKIKTTTGVLPSVDVRNTGFVTMGQSFAFDFTLLAADADSIATAAANPAGQGAGALTLTNTVDGTAASGSFVLPGNGVGSVAGDAGALAGEPGVAKVCIGSTGNDTGINFTIIGTDLFGNVQTEGAITGPGAAAGTDVQSTLLYRTITSVVASGTLTGNITMGYSYIGVASQAIYQLKSKYNVVPNGETPATRNKNLANNINIPARSRITNWKMNIPIAFDGGGNKVFGFGTSSFNNTNVPTTDFDYFTPCTASLKTIATLNYANGFGTITAAMSENYADVSHSDLDAAIGNSVAGIDKEILMRVILSAGAAPANGEAIITVDYAQSVNSVRSN